VVVLAIIGIAAVAPQLSRWQQTDVSVSPVILLRGGAIMSSKPGAGELTAAGYIVADRQSVLAFKGTGRLAKLNVTEAQLVKKDEIIAEIDHHELDAQIIQAQAACAQAAAETLRQRKLAAQAAAEAEAAKLPEHTIDAEIAEIRIRLADAQRRLEMTRNVAANKAMPESMIDDRMTEVKMAEAQIATAELRKCEVREKAKVAEAQAQAVLAGVGVAEATERSIISNIGVLQAQLKDAFVYSPFDGVVTEKAAEVGEIVAPISIGGSMARGSIATIAEWNSLQAEVDVSESYIDRVKAGQRAGLIVDAFPNKMYPGKTIRVLPRANRSKATVLVRVDFVERDKAILPEMGVRVRFLPDDAPPGAESGAVKPTLAIPKIAVQVAGSEKFVWVVNEEQVRKQLIETGETRDDLIEIKQGLNSGDQVVTRNAARLSQNGQRIHVAKE
jgi:RND family efflux transporter MFP subunit